MAWALANGYVVFTHDLDFGTMLALTHATGPSVLQVRGQSVLPEDIGPLVIAALRQHDAALAAGALVVVDVKKSRVRVLPLQQTAAAMSVS
jgi:predicted nuclease of predicted toxin-antitoxin system